MLCFSVIIPTRNRCSILPACINALRDQILSSNLYEVIVVDNKSTDKTAQVVAELNKEPGKRIRYIFEGKTGLMYARHAGARAAGGEILAYIDDDILVTPEWLRQLNQAYQEFDADCAGGKILIRWDQEPPEWVIPYESVLGRLDNGPDMCLLHYGQSINGGNFSIKKQRLYEIGGFNPDQIDDYLVGDGDTGLCYKIHAAGWKMAWVPDALVWHQQYVDKNGTLKDLKRRYANAGVSNAYGNYRQARNNQYLLHKVAQIARTLVSQKLRAWRHKLPHDTVYYYQQELSAARLKGQLCYYTRLIYDATFREFAIRDRWIDKE